MSVTACAWVLADALIRHCRRYPCQTIAASGGLEESDPRQRFSRLRPQLTGLWILAVDFEALTGALKHHASGTFADRCRYAIEGL